MLHKHKCIPEKDYGIILPHFYYVYNMFCEKQLMNMDEKILE
jgi:hypothetical protein